MMKKVLQNSVNKPQAGNRAEKEDAEDHGENSAIIMLLAIHLTVSNHAPTAKVSVCLVAPMSPFDLASE
jgi:hypothetical protein